METRNDIIKFCSTDEARPMLQTPWTINGITYASNGAVLIAMPETGEGYPIGEHQRPEIELSGHLTRFHITQWVPVNQIHNPATEIECEYCNGTGKAMIGCAECYGDGYIECGECGNDKDCETCGGTGNAPRTSGGACTDCGGTGKDVGYQYEIILPCAIVQGKFLALFKDFEFGVSHSPHEPVQMRCGNIRGALMPLKLTDERLKEIADVRKAMGL